MQFDTLRAFPYPVLRPDVDDYVEGDMQVTVDFMPSSDGKEVSASVQFTVSVPELKAEIASGRASYVIVFACRDTYYRRVQVSGADVFDVTFDAGSLRGEVQIYPYIAANSPISGYFCKWINKEFGSGSFNYDAGAVLAVDRPQLVYIDRDVFKPLSSVFELVREESISGYEWQIRKTGEKVQILLSPELKEIIETARNNKSHRAVLMNSIYFAAVMQCLSALKVKEPDALDSRWGKVITQKCHNEGLNIENHDEYLIAERLMKSPFQLIDAYVFKEAA